jgi:hypothetical protein
MVSCSMPCCQRQHGERDDSSVEAATSRRPVQGGIANESRIPNGIANGSRHAPHQPFSSLTVVLRCCSPIAGALTTVSGERPALLGAFGVRAP